VYSGPEGRSQDLSYLAVVDQRPAINIKKKDLADVPESWEYKQKGRQYRNGGRVDKDAHRECGGGIDDYL